MFGIKNITQAAPIDDSLDKLDKIGGISGLGKVTTGDAGIYDKIGAVINIGLGVVGIIAVAYLLFAGFRWITASGNEQIVKESKDTIRNAIIGLVIVFSSFVIVNFVVVRVIEAVG